MIKSRLSNKLEIIDGYLFGICHIGYILNSPNISNRREALMKVKVKRSYHVTVNHKDQDIETIYDFGNDCFLKISHTSSIAHIKGLTLFELEKVCLPNYEKYTEERKLTLKREILYSPITDSNRSNKLLTIEGNEEILIQHLEGLKIRCAYSGKDIELKDIDSATNNIAKIELREPTLRRPYYLLFICYIHPKSFTLQEVKDKIETALSKFHLTVECKPKYGFPPQDGFMGIALIPG